VVQFCRDNCYKEIAHRFEYISHRGKRGKEIFICPGFIHFITFLPTDKFVFMEINQITGEIIDAAIKIHKRLGPGLLESVYEEVLHYELTKRGLISERQVPLPVVYDEIKMDIGFRIDLLVEKKVVVELKSVETVTPFFKKKTLNHLRLTNLQVGLLINFNVELLKNGITRLFNNYAI
jgi:GxxExxY protein